MRGLVMVDGLGNLIAQVAINRPTYCTVKMSGIYLHTEEGRLMHGYGQYTDRFRHFLQYSTHTHTLSLLYFAPLSRLVPE